MWCKSNTANASGNTTPVVTYGSGNMLWGYFSSAVTGKLFRIEGRMKGKPVAVCLKAKAKAASRTITHKPPGQSNTGMLNNSYVNILEWLSQS